MKKGLVVYVTAGKEALMADSSIQEFPLLKREDAATVCFATSEDEVAYGWWHMISRGMHQVFLMTAAYDAVSGQLEPHGTPLRLYG